jgi:hypothetical protein
LIVLKIADAIKLRIFHETLTWEIATEEDFRREVSERWRTRLPDDPEEEKEWKEKWTSLKGSTELPISELIQRFGTFLSSELGTKKLHPRSKKWWTREINEAHAEMGRARADLRNNRSSTTTFKAARKKWFRTVRKAKRICWETFLQEGKEEDIWRAVASKQPPAPMPTIISTLGLVANSPGEKADVLAATSFPTPDAEEPPVTLPEDTLPMKTIWTTEDTARFLGTRSQRSAPGPDNFSYKELRLWFRLDPEGLTTLVNRLVTEGLPREMKMAKVVYIHKPGKTNWSAPGSYRAISLLSTIGKMAEKAVADHLSLVGEQKGWWHKGQCGSRAGRSSIDALAFLKGQVTDNRKIGRHTALLMTDVAAAFPSTTKNRVVSMLIKKDVHPTLIRWVHSWLTDRSIETWIDNKPVGKRAVNCGVPQGSPCSPVLFALTLAETLDKLPDGISYVDDCSWTFNFGGQTDFQREASARLDNIRDTLQEAGFRMDKDKTEVAWFFASERPRGPSMTKAKKWKLEWDGITRRFDIKAKPVRWLGFFLDCRMNWRAHVKHRLALGHHRLRTMARIMTANGIRRKLARKVGWCDGAYEYGPCRQESRISTR